MEEYEKGMMKGRSFACKVREQSAKVVSKATCPPCQQNDMVVARLNKKVAKFYK